MGKTLSEITQTVSVPTIVAATAVSPRPEWSVLLTFVYGGVLTAIGLWQKKRAQEIIDNVGSERLARLIEKDDKTRDALHRAIREVIDEPSEKKRQYFYNYIHNLDKGVRSEFEDHSKLVITLTNMTLEELDVLIDISKYFHEIRFSSGQTDNTYGIPNGITVNTLKQHHVFKNYNERVLDSLLVSLGTNNGLIFVGYGALGGTTFGPITDFGKCFLDYVTREPKKDEEKKP